jgi:hypothetical protein
MQCAELALLVYPILIVWLAVDAAVNPLIKLQLC